MLRITIAACALFARMHIDPVFYAKARRMGLIHENTTVEEAYTLQREFRARLVQ